MNPKAPQFMSHVTRSAIWLGLLLPLGCTSVGGDSGLDSVLCQGLDADRDGVCDDEDVCPDGDDLLDADADSVPDACDICPDGDDTVDTDADTVPDACDVCEGGDDTLDADADTVPDACDVCDGGDDTLDADADTVPDDCDVCEGGDDTLDADADTVPDGCDVCEGGDDTLDADADTVPDDCDVCDDTLDADADTVPDDCDVCDGGDDTLDADADTVPDDCDVCPDGDDLVDVNENEIPDACDPQEIAIDVKVVNGNHWRGWHVIDGSTDHDSDNDNTITGDYREGANSYFVFALPELEASEVVSVTLELELESYSSNDANETFSIWDVSTPSATVEATGYDESIYDDLMSGIEYGSDTVNSSDVGSIRSLELSEDAALDVEAALGGDFTVGVHLDTGSSGWVRFSASSESRVHRITVVYLPG